MSSKFFSTPWMLFAAFGLSLSWLLPNHVPPWTAFHSEAWAAITVGAIALAVAIRARVSVGWNVVTLSLVAIFLVPWIQYCGGLVLSFGTAWMCSIYLLGLVLAVRVGEVWEANQPGQCADYILAAMIIGAVGSTGLQVYQWMAFDPIGAWTLMSSGGRRLSGNLAQPNQLATLQLLGAIGCSWYYGKVQRGSGAIFLLTAMVILFGAALTESRTVWVNIALLAVLGIAFRHILPSRGYVWAIAAAFVFFAMSVLLIPLLNAMIGFGDYTDTEQYRTLKDPIRIGIWKLMLHAISLEPVWGYGWGQTNAANFAVLANSSAKLGLIGSAHNLFLDLVVWNGVPLGGALCFLVAAWAWRALRGVGDFKQLHLVAFILVLGVHSMLEFPLHYAYFLLPMGLIAGATQSTWNLSSLFQSSRLHLPFAITIALGACFVTIRDYLRVENSYYGLRFEARGIPTPIPATPPEVWALRQFADYFVLVRNTPSEGRTEADLDWMRNSVITLSSAQSMYKFAANLALNGHPDDAAHWIAILCKAMPEPNCQVMGDQWRADVHKEIADIPWTKP